LQLRPAASTIQAARSPDDSLRTTPERGLFARAKGDLNSVVNHYNTAKRLGRIAQEQRDLAEYLKSL
jgi:hypothetical protein